MPGAIDDYLGRLERELRQRGLAQARIVDEAREHLVDAVADGRARGLSVEDAEREAFERFGAPAIVAAHAREEDGMMARFAAAVDTLWQRKWWMLAPTLLTAIVTSAVSYHFLPVRYRSEAVVGIVSQRVPAEYVGPANSRNVTERVQELRLQIVSRTRLERLIKEFGLYEVEQESTPLADLAARMREDVKVEYFMPDRATDDEVGTLRVSFMSPDPNTAAKVTERLTGMLLMENLQDREVLADSVNQFIRSQTADLARRIVEYEATLEWLRARSGGRPLSQADLLRYEVLQERYKEFLIKSEEAMTLVNLERRQIGEQFKIFEAARVPERPVGPSRLGVNVAGAFAGLGLGLILVAVRGRSRKEQA